MTGWRVWRAFERDQPRDDSALWRALTLACKVDGRIDVVEFEKWVDVFVWYRRVQA